MNTYTSQSLFDAVWKHFVTDGNPRAITADGECLYRGLNGTKCAVGVVIPDDLYNKGMEALALRDVLRQVPGLEDHAALLGAMQVVHDGAPDDADIADGLRRTAERFDLEIPTR